MHCLFGLCLPLAVKVWKLNGISIILIEEMVIAMKFNNYSKNQHVMIHFNNQKYKNLHVFPKQRSSRFCYLGYS